MPNALACKAVRAVVLLGSAMLLSSSTRAQEPSPQGYWEGAIEIRGNPLDFAVELLSDPNGVWSGTIDIEAQGAHGAPLASVVVEGRKVSFAMPGVPGAPSFDGTLAEDGKSISGDFNQGVFQFPFRLRRSVRRQQDTAAPPSPLTKRGVAGEDLEGIWLGLLDTGAIELRLIARISKNDAGVYRGTIDSVDQGARGLKIETVTLDGEAVRLELRQPAAVFSGKLNSSRSEMEGEWSQGGASLPLTLHRQRQEPELGRPQDPRKPYPYREEEITFRNEAAGLQFAGTLTEPLTKGPHPAVVLISGSGPQDRDEAIMGHRPFLVLADHLTRKGIAVLRFDDRGVGGSQGDVMNATTRDFAGDALAAVGFLKARSEIDAHHIGLLGHSEGAIAAPIAAVQSPDVAFLVLLAAPGLTGEEILYLQSEALIRAMGADEEAITANHELQQRMFAVVKEESDDQKAAQRLEALQRDMLGKLSEEQRKVFGMADESAINEQVKMLLTPWFRFFVTYDPAPTLAKVKCPVLIVSGENDLQVPPDQNLPVLEQALRKGGNTDFKVLRLPGLNHLLQTSQSGLPMEYARIEETIAPAALEAISGWIHDHTAK